MHDPLTIGAWSGRDSGGAGRDERQALPDRGEAQRPLHRRRPGDDLEANAVAQRPLVRTFE